MAPLLLLIINTYFYSVNMTGKRQNLLELSENLTIAPLQCFTCSKMLEFLGNVILTLIKGRNSLTNLRKMTANNANVNLVSINSYIKFDQNLCICSQDNEWKRNFGVNQEP